MGGDRPFGIVGILDSCALFPCTLRWLGCLGRLLCSRFEQIEDGQGGGEDSRRVYIATA